MLFENRSRRNPKEVSLNSLYWKREQRVLANEMVKAIDGGIRQMNIETQ